MESIEALFDMHYAAQREAVRDLLSGVLTIDGAERWLDTIIPALGGVTPMAAIRDDRFPAVIKLARGYRDEHFT